VQDAKALYAQLGRRFATRPGRHETDSGGNRFLSHGGNPGMNAIAFTREVRAHTIGEPRRLTGLRVRFRAILRARARAEHLRICTGACAATRWDIPPSGIAPARLASSVLAKAALDSARKKRGGVSGRNKQPSGRVEFLLTIKGKAYIAGIYEHPTRHAPD